VPLVGQLEARPVDGEPPARPRPSSNPGQTKYMAYGSFGLSTAGTYYQSKYGCDYGEYYGTTSGLVNGFGLTSVGWRVWV